MRYLLKLLCYSLCACALPAAYSSSSSLQETRVSHPLEPLPLLKSQEALSLYDSNAWSILYYQGSTVQETLGQIFLLESLHRYANHEWLRSIEVGYTLEKSNPIRQFLHPIVSTVEVALNIGRHDAQQQSPIYEVAPSIILRWSHFPWNTYINTSLAFGEGVSYVTRIPHDELHRPTYSEKDYNRLLNYLMFEITLAAPRYPNLQFVARIHHRSSAYGLYGRRTGSNIIGFGVRYLFN